jgi:hypothetical protein
MQPQPESFLAGVQAGLERTGREGLKLTYDLGQNLLSPQEQDTLPDQFREPITTARGLLRGENASGRFQELFGEMLTVAIVARDVYGDPPLSSADVETYLRQSFSWFNSFRHA